MKTVLKGLKKSVSSRIAGMVFTLMILSPIAAFSQQGTEPDDQDDPTDLSVPVTSDNNTGPWQNSAGSSVGTSDNTSSGSASDSRNSSAPRLARPTVGPTTDDRDPNGNPDVPFDDNMNLAFLAAGVVFAGLIIRKKLIAKPVPVKVKNN